MRSSSSRPSLPASQARAAPRRGSPGGAGDVGRVAQEPLDSSLSGNAPLPSITLRASCGGLRVAAIDYGRCWGGPLITSSRGRQPRRASSPGARSGALRPPKGSRGARCAGARQCRPAHAGSASMPPSHVTPTRRASSSRMSLSGDREKRWPFGFRRPACSASRPSAAFGWSVDTSRSAMISSSDSRSCSTCRASSDGAGSPCWAWAARLVSRAGRVRQVVVEVDRQQFALARDLAGGFGGGVSLGSDMCGADRAHLAAHGCAQFGPARFELGESLAFEGVRGIREVHADAAIRPQRRVRQSSPRTIADSSPPCSCVSGAVDTSSIAGSQVRTGSPLVC